MRGNILLSVRTRRPGIRHGALTLAAVMSMTAGAAAQTGLYATHVLHVNGACGNDAWSGLSDICEAPDGPKATIQAAIDASVTGDDIVVADGIYGGPGNRDLDFGGKLIEVRSANGAMACEINCAGRAADPHRAFVFRSGENAQAVVRGFTIRNGYAENGGAMWCVGGSPTIRECRFLNNTAEPTAQGDDRGLGGALFCLDDGTIEVTDCYFEGNIARDTASDYSGYGAAIGAGATNGPAGDMLVERCMFTANQSLNYGAVCMSNGYDLVMRDCQFQDNISNLVGGGFAGFAGTSLLERCSFSRNLAQGAYNASGGATYWDLAATGTMIDCEFIDNHADLRAGALKVFRGAQVTAIDCTFLGNKSVEGGGVGLDMNNATVHLINCTLSENSGPEGGGVWVGPAAHVTITNSILWGDTPFEIGDPSTGTVAVAYSIVQGGWEGALDADPLFADPAADDFHVLAYSPAIDAADNTALPPEILTDLDGLARFLDDPWVIDTGVKGGSGGDLVVDMGAYEFQGVSCAADFNADGALDTRDVLAFLNTWTAQDPASDCDGNGVIDTRDVLCFLNLWNTGC